MYGGVLIQESRGELTPVECSLRQRAPRIR